MARTKKQTIDAATARKRQIQEEILNESLAMIGKKETIKSSSSEATNQKSDCVKSKSLEDADRHQSVDSSASGKSENSVEFPTAVICITDIYKSSPELLDSASVKLSKNCHSPKSQGGSPPKSGQGKDVRVNIFEAMDACDDKKRTSSKSPSSKSPSPSSRSPIKIKIESGTTSGPSPKRSETSSSPSDKINGKPQGRRSPRSQPPSTGGTRHTDYSCDSSLLESQLPHRFEKPKINIFTDNLGVDLGKRVRSPRRLSEDMIALPIYSVRRTGNSPKENLGLSKCQDGENLMDNSSLSIVRSSSSSVRRLSPNESFQSIISTHGVDMKNFSYLTPPNTFESFVSITSEESSLKKSKNQFRKTRPLTNKDSVSDQESAKTNVFNPEGHLCDKSVVSSCGDAEKQNVELLMSSICKDIIGEVASESGHVFQKSSKRNDRNKPDLENKNKINEQKSVETVTLIENVKNNNDTDSPSEKEIKKEDTIKHERQESTDNCNTINTKEQTSSLLCAMLVGGTDVAHDYRQKKEKLKPDATECVETDEDHSKVMSSDLPISSFNMNSASLSSIVVKTSDSSESSAEKDVQHSQQEILGHCASYKDDLQDAEQMNNDNEAKSSEDLLDSQEKSEHRFPDLQGNSSALTSDFKKENVSMEDSSSSEVKDDENPSNWKKSKIDFSTQLKRVNESVLKLADIDIEDQFLNWQDKCNNSSECSSVPVLKQEPESETELYSLISSLGLRLKADYLKFPSSGVCDDDSLDQMVQSCPKGRQQIISSFGDAMWNKILERLNEEENIVDRHQTGIIISSSEITKNTNCETKSSLNSSCGSICTNTIDSIGADKTEPKSLSREKEDGLAFPSNDDNGQNLHQSSISSQNESLCDLDVDAMTSAVTLAFSKSESTSSQSQPSTSSPKHDTEKKGKNQLKDCSEKPTRRLFQKALTCSDFNSGSETETLRRISSSPQLFKSTSTSSTFMATSHDEGEGTSKSKLGSKIPIPGTIIPSKSCKKSWRTPRILMNPKPLKILSQHESDVPNRDIFMSADLQKYLWIPSNRMIVTSAIREEIKRADETAESAWEAKSLIMKEEEEKRKKDDEEVNRQFSQHKPDFDEVEGLLFMSFSNEIELKAHIHVEKALEWDIDDTMLRISRAKAFEEAKAVNGNMKEVKMKHLRGQHMRWKKYKRMYTQEVITLIDAKEKGIPFDQVKSFRKTSDVTKIKGWKRRSKFLKDTYLETKPTDSYNIKGDTISGISFNQYELLSPFVNNLGENLEIDSDFITTGTNETLDLSKNELSPKSRRRFNFSDKKAHRQLFKELKMDWEDRMIHRKLGGWSLKGNRPRAFSQAAIKRQKRDIQNKLTSPLSEVSTDIVSDISMTDLDTDVSPCASTSNPRKKKLVYPLLTEKLARNCLKTLETGDVLRALKKNKKKKLRKEARGCLPSLTPIPISTNDLSSSQPIVSPATLTIKDERSTPLRPVTSLSSLSSPLNLDLLDETVPEGVDITSRISSPSVTDYQSSPQVKICSKPGCRYGCICHLCSANESPTLAESSLSKSSAPVCDKEYCRLGCICDSLDPEQSSPTQAHCGKPSCMLECVCSDSGLTSSQVDGSDEIPFLSSMKQRPKIGERFSNLPRREKTHRTAKNLDAVTRKALMLYETSEIYCEKVERAKKREYLETSKAFIKSNNLPETIALSESTHHFEPRHQSQFDVIEIDDCMSDESPYPKILEEFPYKKRDISYPSPDVEMSDVVQSLPIMEPSAHKRKRKSHPLSAEIFTHSTCARIQPYSSKKSKLHRLMTDSTDQSVTSSMLLMASSSHLNSKEHRAGSSKQKNPGFQDFSMEKGLSELKISEVKSLSAKARNNKDEKVTSSPVDMTINEDSGFDSYAHISSKTPSGLVSFSKTQESEIKVSTHQDSAAEEKSHGWHTSMVCLKAKAPSKGSVQSEDDIQEEDEVKLLEFAADCNWDSAKRAILAQVASCLVRGHYPQPRTMNVGEFVVEILPKAQQPTRIPQELRAKLPQQMYSIRVRITRRDDPSKTKPLISPKAVDSVIDLSVPSPAPKNQLTSSASSQLICTESKTLKTHSSCNVTTSSNNPQVPSHFGLSGLSQMCVSYPGANLPEQIKKSTSAPGSRRSSLEMSRNYFKLSSSDDTSNLVTSVYVKNAASSRPTALDAKSAALNTSNKNLSSCEILSSTNLNATTLSVSSLSSVVPVTSNKKILSPLTQTVKLIPTSTSLLKRSPLVAGSTKGKVVTPFLPPQVNASNPVLTVLNPKAPTKYVQLPRNSKEPVMVYEVDVKTDKKTLIAVPLSLAGKGGEIKGKPVLTVPMPAGGQQKVLPLLASRPKVTNEVSPQYIRMKATTTSSQPLFVKLPHINPPVIVPTEKISNSHGVLHIVPVSAVQKNASTKHINVAKPLLTSTKLAKPPGRIVSATSADTTVGNSVSQSGPKAKCDTSLNSTSTDPSPLSTTVTQSRERPISSSEVSSVKKELHIISNSDSDSASSSKSEISKKILTEDKADCQITSASTHIPVSDPIVSPHKKAELNYTKNTIQESGSSLSPQDSHTQCLDVQNSISNPEETLAKHSDNGLKKQEVFSPNNEQNTQSDISDPKEATLSSTSCSSLSSGPISYEESFSGFSVVKDLSFPVLPVQNKSSDGLEPSSSISDPAVKASHHKFQRDSEHGENTFTVISSKLDSSSSEPIVSSFSKKSAIAVISKSVSQSLINEKTVTPSDNILKRSSPELGWEEDGAPEAKRSKLLDDCLPPEEDDISLIPTSASPHSSCSRPKSGLSSVLSSGSLSSDEEIDVGENPPADAFIIFKEQVERAWENDHSTMLMPQFYSADSKSNLQSDKSLAASGKGIKGDFLTYHKYLERARRARQKELFNNLSDAILTVPIMKVHLQKINDLSAMPKVMILDSAKTAIEHLTESFNSSEAELAEALKLNESLKRELQKIEAELLRRNMAGRAIAAIVNRAARQTKKQQENNTSQNSSDEVDGTSSQADDSLNVKKDDACMEMDNPFIEQSEDPCSQIQIDDPDNIESEIVYSQIDDPINLVSLSDGACPQTDDTINLLSDGLCFQNDEPVSLGDDPVNLVSPSTDGEKIDEDSSVPKYEDISDWENNTNTSQDPVMQYEDITDEESSS